MPLDLRVRFQAIQHQHQSINPPQATVDAAQVLHPGEECIDVLLDLHEPAAHEIDVIGPVVLVANDLARFVRAQFEPATYFQDIQSDPGKAANIVPFSQFSADLSSNSLPQFSFVVPNMLDDAHDGTLADADAWLQKNIDPLINNPAFQSSGVLIITFDEGAQSDLDQGGGHVATVIVSSKSKMNFTSQKIYTHPSTLRLILEASGVGTFPGAAAVAPEMTEFFQ